MKEINQEPVAPDGSALRANDFGEEGESPRAKEFDRSQKSFTINDDFFTKKEINREQNKFATLEAAARSAQSKFASLTPSHRRHSSIMVN